MGRQQNILIVGAGFSGAVIARELAERNHRITVIDKRNHIGGNCYDYVKDQVRIHKYGPHIFHTSNKKIFNWLSNFTTWIDYRHKVTALYNNQFYPFPPTDDVLELFADKIYDIFYKPYSKKMWGEFSCKSALKRTKPNNSNFYFPNDIYQGFPKHGYTKLFEKILDHKNILVELNTEFSHDQEINYTHVFNSMSIDEYYNYCYGTLNYRSIKFHHTNKIDHLMPTAVVNYTDNSKYSRVVRWELFPEHGNNSLYTLEEPCNYIDNKYERYYPIRDDFNINISLYNKYKNITNLKTTFIGRCGMYTYLDMDQAISVSMSLIKQFVE